MRLRTETRMHFVSLKGRKHTVVRRCRNKEALSLVFSLNALFTGH